MSEAEAAAEFRAENSANSANNANTSFTIPASQVKELHYSILDYLTLHHW